ncbi:hypothetical protein NCM_06287 [Burkholderia pseudomallei]|nr:putative membrane protein [Burkholderia pseudomallei MSHR332]
MNWFGIVVLGFAVGLLGWALNPLRRLSRASLWLAAAAGVLGAAAAKMAGNVAGLFTMARRSNGRSAPPPRFSPLP